ncbi:hypothetical protein PV646_10650 [Streptomyces sp. ID05-26A]|nr:hypothetical protein [Streptomyces sp. ID05-26A]
MRLGKSLAAVGLAAAATLGLAAPASAITPTTCWPDNGQLRITWISIFEKEYRCFANAGSTNTNLTSSSYIRSGNNQGNVEFIDTDGTPRFTPFFRWEEKSLANVKITKVTIY